MVLSLEHSLYWPLEGVNLAKSTSRLSALTLQTKLSQGNTVFSLHFTGGMGGYRGKWRG